MPPKPAEDRAVERWFLHRGLTPMLDGTPLRSRTSVRSVPALLLAFVVVMLVILPGATANVALALGISCLATLLTWVAGNLARRRRPFARVERIGWVEAAAFLLVPTGVAVLGPHDDVWFDGTIVSAGDARVLTVASVFILQVVLLAVVLSVVQLGIVSASMLVMRELFSSLEGAATVMARTLPLLLGVVTFIFFTGELWQSVGRLNSFGYVAVVLLFVLVSAAFLTRREHVDVDGLARFETEAQVREALEETPLRGAQVALQMPYDCALSRHQERNLLVVAAMSRLMVAAVVACAVFAFFLVLGWLTVNEEVVKAWSGSAASVIARWDGGLHTYALTWEHLRVAGFLAVFSGFYYAVVSATDPTLREGLRDTAAENVRAACALRAVLLEREAGASAEPLGRRPEPDQAEERRRDDEQAGEPGQDRLP